MCKQEKTHISCLALHNSRKIEFALINRHGFVVMGLEVVKVEGLPYVVNKLKLTAAVEAHTRHG
jgi:hypothetical protein